MDSQTSLPRQEESRHINSIDKNSFSRNEYEYYESTKRKHNNGALNGVENWEYFNTSSRESGNINQLNKDLNKSTSLPKRIPKNKNSEIVIAMRRKKKNQNMSNSSIISNGKGRSVNKSKRRSMFHVMNQKRRLKQLEGNPQPSDEHLNYKHSKTEKQLQQMYFSNGHHQNNEKKHQPKKFTRNTLLHTIKKSLTSGRLLKNSLSYKIRPRFMTKKELSSNVQIRINGEKVEKV